MVCRRKNGGGMEEGVKGEGKGLSAWADCCPPVGYSICATLLPGTLLPLSQCQQQ